MSKLSKLHALVLSLAMVFALAACGGGNPPAPAAEEPAAEEPAAEEPAAEEPAAEEPARVVDENTPLVIGYSPLNSKFSPFFSETAYDQEAMSITQVPLLPADRTGAVLLNSMEGETVEYNGTPYTYYGIANCEITENEDGTVYYDFTLRDDVTFSDGEPLTVDDVIFSMYVLCDPTYDGSSTLYAQPIEGMEAYRSGMDTLLNLIFDAGRDNADFTNFTEEQQTAFWTSYDAATTALAEEIVAYCVDAGAADEGDIIGAAGAWGFGIEENTIEAFVAALQEAYGSDVANMINTEAAGSTVEDLFPGLEEYSTAGIETGESAASISGIQKIDDTHLRVVLTKVDATAIYQLTLYVAPMHYYGDASLYDYENNSFGFPKGDLSSVRAKTTQPMGAGPYKFIKFENGVVYFEANEYYYQGCPKTKYLNFQQCTADDDKLNGVITGNIDITDPSFSMNTVEAIEKANGGELNGDKVTVNTVDNLGYGYIGIAASRVNVGGVKDSDASKNLRKAIATVLAVYRDLSVDSYYGDRASVINYPISNTSWAAPQSTDDGYQVAFSVDVNGAPIYTSGMSAEDKYAAALEASLGFFEAAGYTVEDGKLTAAPEGAKLAYECWIPGDGTGDHPSFMIATEAHDAFATIGFDLIVKDLANSSDLWDGLDADAVDMWCAAWGASVDPDMYQIYYSTNVPGLPGSTGSNHYNIQDAELDQLILDARASTDQAYRKVMYKACLDIIIDWAVEIPVYQRQNAIIFSTERVNLDTVTPDITTFYGWNAEIQNTLLK